jgi:hypothetical protein
LAVEEVEQIIYNLMYELDTEATNKKVQDNKAANRDLIRRNQQTETETRQELQLNVQKASAEREKKRQRWDEEEVARKVAIRTKEKKRQKIIRCRLCF